MGLRPSAFSKNSLANDVWALSDVPPSNDKSVVCCGARGTWSFSVGEGDEEVVGWGSGVTAGVRWWLLLLLLLLLVPWEWLPLRGGSNPVDADEGDRLLGMASVVVAVQPLETSRSRRPSMRLRRSSMASILSSLDIPRGRYGSTTMLYLWFYGTQARTTD